jgi:hypothetical protein
MMRTTVLIMDSPGPAGLRGPPQLAGKRKTSEMSCESDVLPRIPLLCGTRKCVDDGIERPVGSSD